MDRPRKSDKNQQSIISPLIDKLCVLENKLWRLTFSGFHFLVHVLFVRRAKITAMKNPPEKRNYDGKNQTPPAIHIGVDLKSGSFTDQSSKEYPVASDTMHFYFIADDISETMIDTEGVHLKVGGIVYTFHYLHENTHV